jgi:glycine cleavage system H protein
MADDQTFMMGKYAAHLPGDRRYARNHMWCQVLAGRVRCGFSAYAVRLMQDVYFLEWHQSPGAALAAGALIGHIETSKAVSDLFAPLAGTVSEFNAELLNDPTPINLDCYAAGWLFDLAGDTADTLTVDEYHEYLSANWEKTQRLIKGKINADE